MRRNGWKRWIYLSQLRRVEAELWESLTMIETLKSA